MAEQGGRVMNYDVFAFITDPRQADVEWWIEKAAGRVVTMCPHCGASAHHPLDGPMTEFSHADDCATRLGDEEEGQRWVM